MTVLMNPDCLDQKHRACSGDGWCESTDQAVPCPCHCHQLDQPAPIGVNLCCGRTFPLTRTPDGWTGQPNHLNHCPNTGAFLMPETKEDA